MKRFALLAAAGLALACPVALQAQADPAPAAEALPDWRGIWFTEGAVPDINGLPRFGAAGSQGAYPLLNLTAAPWNDNGRARLQAMISSQGDDKAPGWGYPMMMSGSAPLQFLITPDETLILNIYRDLRHVYTDGRPLPPDEDRWPTVWGEAVGHWEGDTLVIETVSVEEPLKYFFATPPISANARYIERIRKVGPDRIENEMTIEDPDTLAAPWIVKIAYVRAEGLDRLIHEAFTNDRSEVENGVFTIEPPSQSE
jgi:hypothetical protein